MEVFLTSTALVALAEIGDKTQLATVALAARFDALLVVVMGTTIGMMVANVPAVIIGEKLAAQLPLTTIRWIAATVFIVTGLAT
ncbi:MAG TPA: TMEM165/GDT1 family protein, partial [Rhodocyclaceae bacterium]|nr:TMEM165/GDT1 family protein [Rhodocyclaceae bacterium]